MKLCTSLWKVAVSLWLLAAAHAVAAAPDEFDFSGYRNAKALANLYIGRFGATHGADERLASDERADRKTLLAQVFLTYHGLYSSNRCIDQAREDKVELITRETTRYSPFGDPVVRDYKVTIRTRFLAAWRGAESQFVRGTLASLDMRVMARFLEIDADVKQFFQAAGCASETAVQFEENLHRAVMDGAPVQDAMPFPAKAPRFARGCATSLPSLRPSAGNSCECIYGVLRSTLYPEQLWALEDNFTQERFLLTSVARPGVHEKVGQCFR